MRNIKKEDIETTYAATIGFFDGVHLGHRYLIDELKEIANQKGQKSLIVTFDCHPRKVLHAHFQPKLLTSFDEKIVRLMSTGADKIVTLNFTEDTAKLSAYNFMKNILKQEYNITTLLVGHDHHFGHNRAETLSDYVRYGKELGIEVIQTSCFSMGNALNVSSSEIRKALQEGEVGLAETLLGYRYSFEGKVTEGFKMGRKIGFPTANLTLYDNENLIPDSGVYAVKVSLSKGEFLGMLNIGCRPTLNNGDNKSIEVHIIDFNQDIYNQNLKITFLKKLRDEKKFKDINELVTQLCIDKEAVMKYKNLERTQNS